MGPVLNLTKVNVGGGILAVPLTFVLCGTPLALGLVAGPERGGGLEHEGAQVRLL